MCLRHLQVMDSQRAMVHLCQVVMEVRRAMVSERVVIVHSHRVTINLQLTMMEEIMTMVTVHRQAIAEKKVAMKLDLDLMGIVEGVEEIHLIMKETWRQDLGGLALLLILRTVGARAKSKVEGVYSLISYLKF